MDNFPVNFSRKEDVGAVSAEMHCSICSEIRSVEMDTHTQLTWTLNFNLEWFRGKKCNLRRKWISLSLIWMFHCCCSYSSRESRVQNRKGPERAVKMRGTKGQRCDPRIKTKNWGASPCCTWRGAEKHRDGGRERGLIQKITKGNSKWQVDGYGY